MVELFNWNINMPIFCFELNDIFNRSYRDSIVNVSLRINLFQSFTDNCEIKGDHFLRKFIRDNCAFFEIPRTGVALFCFFFADVFCKLIVFGVKKIVSRLAVMVVVEESNRKVYALNFFREWVLDFFDTVEFVWTNTKSVWTYNINLLSKYPSTSRT